MELELGLKLTRVADEFSSADFLLAKDRGGPLFISTESDTVFFLTALLKGYRKQNIKIEINEDGTRIIIRGEKLVQETVIVGWKLHKETEKREFKKAFKIPEGVILDKIKAKFDDDESILTISIPKKEKGIRGLSIEEVKEREIAREGSERLQIVPDDSVEFPKGEDVLQEKQAGKEAEYAEESGLSEENSVQVPETGVQEPKETGPNVTNPEETREAEVHNVQEEKMKETQQDQNGRLQKLPSGQDLVETDTTEEMKSIPGEGSGEATAKAPVVDTHNVMEEAAKPNSGVQVKELEKKPIGQSTEEKMGGKHDKCPHSGQDISQDQHDLKENNIQQDEEEKSPLVEPTDKAQSQESMPSSTREERGRCKLCTPIFAGSALLLSLVAFVIHFIRTKSQPGKRKD